MTLESLVKKTCLLGLSYFDANESMIHQRQIAAEVLNADEENGISLRVIASSDDAEDNKPLYREIIASQKTDDELFIIPASLVSWFIAPEGHYRDASGQSLIENPDYFVTWDIHRSQADVDQGAHEWWEWRPRIAPPSVSN